MKTLTFFIGVAILATLTGVTPIGEGNVGFGQGVGEDVGTCGPTKNFRRIELRPHYDRPKEKSTHPVFITLCHDQDKVRTLWAYNKLTHERTQFSRPDDNWEDFFITGVNPDTSMSEHAKTMTELLGMQPTDPEFKKLYQSYLANLFWAKGHLTPSTHAANRDQARSTFFHVNQVPQWQEINAGNWGAMENAAVAYVQKNKVDLDIWTGAEGVVQFPNGRGQYVPVYLGRKGPAPGSRVSDKLPAPKFLWKVMSDPKSKSALVMVTINTPYDYPGRKDDEMVSGQGVGSCDRTHFYAEKKESPSGKGDVWDVNNRKKGFTMCYTVAEFCTKFRPACQGIPTLQKLTSDNVPILMPKGRWGR